MINTRFRTGEPENMDNFELEGPVLQEALDKIAHINQLLGGNRLTLQGVEKLLRKADKTRTITFVDVGCGNGDMLRMLANYAKRKGYTFNLIGVDANAFTIAHAQKLSNAYPNIAYRCQNIFDVDFEKLRYDVLLCTLTLHHFSEEEIVKTMALFYTNCSIGLVVNDLQRSWLSYRLFQGVCLVFGLNEMSRKDGLTSILRGFTKRELVVFSKKATIKKYTLSWKWAFRYQWICVK